MDKQNEGMEDMPDTMKAVLIDRITKAEQIQLTQVPVPNVKPGWVLVKVRAFGMNHSEQILRLSEIESDYIKKPVIPGIECVGEIADPSDSDMEIGDKVVALMGGMGRSFDGSYAEYALLPVTHVFPIKSDLPWEYMAAVPETYFTAWGSLFESLALNSDDTLLIRGATCALGYVAIQIAKALGCRVIATTHKESKLELISEADESIIDDGNISGKVDGVTKALDLIGPRYLRDTMEAVEKGGVVCQTGILGGVFSFRSFNPIKDIPNGVYLTGFVSNFPEKNVIREIFEFIQDNGIVPVKGKTFSFEDIRDACIAQDEGSINGKIVVKI